MNFEYLELLARALSGDPYAHLPTYRPLSLIGIKFPRLRLLAILERALRLIRPDARICIEQAPDKTGYRRFPVTALTMIGYKRLMNLYFCLKSIHDRSVPGDVIETGVWRGGACIFMRETMNRIGMRRVLYACDSFAGLPPPVADADAGDLHYKRPELAISLEEVKQNFAQMQVSTDNVEFVKGFFSATLPALRKFPRRWALIRLDGDMYESTKVALENLYPDLSPGGYCIIDDWHLPACRRAVEEYRQAHGITSQVQVIDDNAAYWQK